MNLTESEIEEKLASRASFTVRFKLTPFQEGFKVKLIFVTYIIFRPPVDFHKAVVIELNDTALDFLQLSTL